MNPHDNLLRCACLHLRIFASCIFASSHPRLCPGASGTSTRRRAGEREKQNTARRGPDRRRESSDLQKRAGEMKKVAAVGQGRRISSPDSRGDRRAPRLLIRPFLRQRAKGWSPNLRPFPPVSHPLHREPARLGKLLPLAVLRGALLGPARRRRSPPSKRSCPPPKTATKAATTTMRSL